MCAITGFTILGLLVWGVYTAGQAAWHNRSNIAYLPFVLPFLSCTS